MNWVFGIAMVCFWIFGKITTFALVVALLGFMVCS